MRNRIQEALKHSKADYTEIRMEASESTRVVFRGKVLETAGTVMDGGGLVRCLIRDKGWGVATFSSLDDLNARVDQASTCAGVGSVPEPIELGGMEPIETTVVADELCDPRRVPLAEKKAAAERYNDILLSGGDRIVDTQTAYGDTYSRVVLATSEGVYIQQERPQVVISATAISRDGDNVQRAHDSRATSRGFTSILGRDDVYRGVARRALDMLGAQPVKAGRYTLVADNILAGVFIHEAFGHLSEADFVYENPDALKMMTLGRRFGSGLLDVFDDGSVPDLRGTILYDDEGTPARRNWLLKEGVLVGRLHSRQTASRMGEAPTGNARALNYRFAPIVRMTNTAIRGGATSVEDMIGDVDLGVYACDCYGGQTQLEDFSFSSAYAYMIRKGRIAEMVKDVVLAGNLFVTLRDIDAIGNDFRWHNQGGGCGKNLQVPLPVAFGAPHVRIRNVAIGGV